MMIFRNLRDCLENRPIELVSSTPGNITGTLYCNQNGIFFQTLQDEGLSGKEFFCEYVDDIGCAYISLGTQRSLIGSTAVYEVRFVLYGNTGITSFAIKDIKRISVHYLSFLPQKVEQQLCGGEIKLGNGFLCKASNVCNKKYERATSATKRYLSFECTREDGATIEIDVIRKFLSRLNTIFSCLMASPVVQSYITLSGEFDDTEEKFELLYERGNNQYANNSNSYGWHMVPQAECILKAIELLFSKDLTPAFNLNTVFAKERQKPAYLEDLLGGLYKSIDSIAKRQQNNSERKEEYDDFLKALGEHFPGSSLEEHKEVIKYIRKLARSIYLDGNFTIKMHHVLDPFRESCKDLSKEYYNEMCEYSGIQRNSIMHDGIIDHAKEEEFNAKFKDKNYLADLKQLVQLAVEQYIEEPTIS